MMSKLFSLEIFKFGIKRFKKVEADYSGQALVLSVVVVGLVLVNTLMIIGGSQLFYQNTTYITQAAQAVNLAEAGIDKALASLNTSGGSYIGESGTSLGVGSFSVSITSVSSNTKIIESTGYIPSITSPKVKRTIKINVTKGVGAAFRYGIQVGSGGLIMHENSIVNGSVYANGNIQMDNNAQIKGDAYVASGVESTANQESECVSLNCTDFFFGKNIDGQERLDVTQGFKPSTSNIINKVSLRLKKIGSPSDMTIRILRDNSGRPDKNNVLAAGTLASNLVTTDYGFVDVTFPAPPLLNAETTYWLTTDTSSNSSNYWSWSNDSLQGYTRGIAMWSYNWQSNNSDWTTINGDLDFKTYMGGVATSISGGNGTIITGDAHANTLRNLSISGGAYYQAKENITASSYHPGSSDPMAIPMPLSEGNVQTWKNLAQASGIYNGDINGCPPNLAAGKYQGSISLSSNCTVVVDSPIWVTGNFNMSNNNIIKLNPSFGESSGVFMVDSLITLNNGNKIQGTGTSGSYLILLSEFNSRDDPLGRAAITLTNQDNSGIIYSNLGLINIANNNNLTEISAWKIELGNNVIVNYDQGLANTFFSSGPSGSYSLVRGTYQLK